ncbi:MAG: radical SAM protein [Candidatus Riflebacteria bacterium]
MPEFAIKRLLSGGLITNYSCSSNCQHCLYACSPRRRPDYINEEDALKYLGLIRAMGCNTVHIGGGEPFLQPEKLLLVLKAANQAGVKIEYVETNSSWFRSDDDADRILQDLRQAGLRTLLVSISPFHAEFVPLAKVNGVMQACSRNGINVFPWVRDFYQDFTGFDQNETVDIAQLVEVFGQAYLNSIVQRYWIQPNGRAINFLKKVYQMKSSVDLASDRTGCQELLQTSHFHLDLYGNYIPGLCAGLSIRYSDLGKTLNSSEYKLINILAESGPAGLVDHATGLGYRMAHEYLNKCHLCQDIRRFLLREKGIDSQELQPREFYAFIE